MQFDALPHSLEAEQLLLGCVLAELTPASTLVATLVEDDFYREPHRLIYGAILALFRTREEINIISVQETLKAQGKLDDVGGRSYINDLALSVVTSGTVEYHVKLVKDKAVARRVIEAGYGMISAGHLKTGAEALIEGQRLVLQLAKESESKGDHPAAKFVPEALESLVLAAQGGSIGVSTGFAEIDRLIGGFTKGEMIVLAARPGMGKSAMAINFASNIAFRGGLPVLFYSLEMRERDIVKRILCSEAGTTSNVEKLSQVKIPNHYFVLNRSNLTIEQLRASVSRYKSEHPELGLVVVDYLGLLQASGSSSYEKTTAISQGLKGLAMEFDVPVLALSQLSRAVEGRQDKRPVLSDLRDSGSIEQDADEVILLYREKYYDPTTDKGDSVDVGIAKNRDGAVGVARLLYREALTKFIDAREVKRF